MGDVSCWGVAAPAVAQGYSAGWYLSWLDIALHVACPAALGRELLISAYWGAFVWRLSGSAGIQISLDYRRGFFARLINNPGQWVVGGYPQHWKK